MTCPTCKAPWLEVPVGSIDHDNEERALPPLPPQAKRRSIITRPPWISRPINRKDSEFSSYSSPFSFDSSYTRRRRPSSVISDSSSQTRVETASSSVPVPPLRSVLSGASSISSGKVTLAGKRSVKFSDEPVYFDYSCRCSRADYPLDSHAPCCKLPYECAGECWYDAGCYDYDMFSFEQPEEIPSERKWGILSRFVAWLRRKTRGSSPHDENGRPSISRPLPLSPHVRTASIKRDRDKGKKPKRQRR